MIYVKTYADFVNELLIHDKKSDKVLIFDVDDTLIKSNTKVFVIKDGKIVKKLTTQEYSNYKLGEGEYFSYDEFTKLDKMLKAETTPYFKTMEREYDRGIHVSILTARSNKKMIHDFFLQKANIDIHPNLIFAIGDDVSEKSVAEKKADCIKTLVGYGYKTLIFFDDNVDNLKMVKEMGDKLNVTVHVIKA